MNAVGMMCACRPACSRGAAGWALFAAIAFAAPAVAQTAAPARATPSRPAASAHDGQAVAPVAPVDKARRQALHRPVLVTDKERTFYRARFGVDKLSVSYTSSGNLIRFTYRVLDVALARPLTDKANTPFMLGQRSRAMLQVPVMEKVGPLRQTNDLVAGKEYWVAFSNKGNLVRPGDRVNVTIGAFHADGLLVE